MPNQEERMYYCHSNLRQRSANEVTPNPVENTQNIFTEYSKNSDSIQSDKIKIR